MPRANGLAGQCRWIIQLEERIPSSQEKRAELIPLQSSWNPACLAESGKLSLQSGSTDLACRRPQCGKPKKENIMKLTKSGLELKEVIEKAMNDHVITNSEYVEIMKAASNDGIIDDHEQRLLSQLQELLENGTLERIAG
jgi:hypothetical protein